MATRDEMFPSNWLKASDVETPVIAKVRCTPTETVGQGAKAEQKTVLYFQGDVLKPLPVNRTNWDEMVRISGEEDSDDWEGTEVELFAIDVMGPNGPTRGVRIRRPKARAGKAKRVASTPAPLETTDEDAVGF